MHFTRDAYGALFSATAGGHQQLAELAYMRCLESMDPTSASASYDRNMFFASHQHIAVVRISARSASVEEALKRSFFSVTNDSVNEAKQRGCTHLYLMAVDSSRSCVVAIGGISLERFESKASCVSAGGKLNALSEDRYSQRKAGGWEIHRSSLVPLSFYDAENYARENLEEEAHSLPPVDSEVSVSPPPTVPLPLPPRPETIRREAPADIYLREPDAKQMTALNEGIRSSFDVSELMERRFRALSLADGENNTPDYGQITNDSIFDGIRDEASNGEISAVPPGRDGLAQFEDITDRADLLCNDFVGPSPASLRVAVDILSHWFTSRYVLAFTRPGDRTRAWFAAQEERLVRARLRGACASESDMDVVVSHNDIRSLTCEGDLGEGNGLREECNTLFEQRFPGAALPTRWYSAAAVDCLALGLRMIAAGSTAPVRGGRCYLSWRDLREDYLPLALSNAIETRQIDGDACKRSKSGQDGAEARLYALGEEIASRIESKFAIRSSTAAPDSDPLPPIEDCANSGLLPPCNMLYYRLLACGPPHHLMFDERKGHSSFLLDCGWDKATVHDYLRRWFMEDGRTSEDTFNTKYASVVRRKEEGVWENGRRTVPYGHGCKKLVSGEHNAAPNNQVGCPFRRLDESKLRALLSCYGPIDSEALDEIVYISQNTDNAQEACACFFAARHGDTPHGGRGTHSWRPRSPQGYFKGALRIAK